jgi:hypothetical protein
MSNTVHRWHEMLDKKDTQALASWLDDDVVFYSPVVHTPQRGKALTKMYLSAAFMVLGNESFRYLREIVGERDAVLEFELEIDGILINGVDMMKWNDEGKVIEFKVMLRPLKAINVVQQKMGELLAKFGGKG